MEPVTPQPKVVIAGSEVTLVWTKRSEAVLSRLGYDVSALIDALRKRRTAFYGICLGVFCALPANRLLDAPEDLAESLKDIESQNIAIEGLLAVIRTAYPPPAEKKSDLKP